MPRMNITKAELADIERRAGKPRATKQVAPPAKPAVEKPAPKAPDNSNDLLTIMLQQVANQTEIIKHLVTKMDGLVAAVNTRKPYRAVLVKDEHGNTKHIDLEAK